MGAKSQEVLPTLSQEVLPTLFDSLSTQKRGFLDTLGEKKYFIWNT